MPADVRLKAAGVGQRRCSCLQLQFACRNVAVFEGPNIMILTNYLVPFHIALHVPSRISLVFAMYGGIASKLIRLSSVCIFVHSHAEQSAFAVTH